MLDADKSKSATRTLARKRIHDSESTKQNIVEVATEEFARNGLAGARIDEIAARTKSSKRMIYYYFGDKEGLYVAALESVYQKIRAIESELDLKGLPPVEALKRLVEFTFDYQAENEDFVRLVMTENIHHGQYLAKSKVIQELNVTAIDTIRDLYQRGVKDGVFRKGLDPVDIHWSISALCFFNVSNRATFANIFKRNLSSRKQIAARRDGVVEMILRHVMR